MDLCVENRVYNVAEFVDSCMARNDMVGCIVWARDALLGMTLFPRSGRGRILDVRHYRDRVSVHEIVEWMKWVIVRYPKLDVIHLCLIHHSPEN